MGGRYGGSFAVLVPNELRLEIEYNRFVLRECLSVDLYAS